MQIDPRAQRMTDAEALGVLGRAQERLRAQAAGAGQGEGRAVAGSTVPGRPLSEFQRGTVRWLYQPYFPRDALVLLVGEGSVGKSSLIAWLLAQSRSAILFPGFEESFTVQTLPRLQVYATASNNVRVITEREWYLPEAKTRLTRAIQALGADLVVFDPISSYLAEGGNENDGQFVRPALEAIAEVAAATGACVVGTRHPGKEASNVMVGSREWRAVPRCVVQLMVDPGPPLRRIIRLHKDALGQGQSARSYSLHALEGEPPRFELGGALTASDSAVLDRWSDDVDRARYDHAQALLLSALRDGEQPSKALYALAENERISERTLFRAAAGLGVVMERKGSGLAHQSIWRLPEMEEGGGTPARVSDTPHCTDIQGGCHPGTAGVAGEGTVSSQGGSAPDPEPAVEDKPKAKRTRKPRGQGRGRGRGAE